MATETIEIIAGVGRNFDNYGYLAFRPPLDEQAIEAIVQSNVMPTRPVLTQISEIASTTEFEYRQEASISQFDMERLAATAAAILRDIGYATITHRRYVRLEVDNTASIFSQYENQRVRVSN